MVQSTEENPEVTDDGMLPFDNETEDSGGALENPGKSNESEITNEEKQEKASGFLDFIYSIFGH